MATFDRLETEGTLVDDAGLPWLEDGKRMDQETFHERYERTTRGFRAELIGGIVYLMPSRVDSLHGERHCDLIGWLGRYHAATPGTSGLSRATILLGPESEPQPDATLLILPEYGGQTRLGGPGDDYTVGPPELVAEVVTSSEPIELHAKFDDYERAGVREYVVLDLRRQQVHWSRLLDGRFVPIAADADGLMRSHVFPGLWLDPIALVGGDIAQVFAVLKPGLASPEHAAFVAELGRKWAANGKRPPSV